MARILIVEDSDQLRNGLERALTQAGYDVVTAENGGRAIAIFESSDPTSPGVDLVVTDINMPETDGIELILSLRERQPALPVLAISGGGLVPKEHLLEDAHALGATEVLEKPFLLPVFVEAIERLLR
ncbi:MAG: response regulator [Longimicrobiales bacterium]